MNYSGFGAWCAAYAFLNTVENPVVRAETYELLSGVPFGLKHCNNDPFRILTPLYEPCLMVETAAGRLGYSAHISRYGDSAEMVGYINSLPMKTRVLVGPVDMGCLLHLPQNLYYCGQSHYISIEVCNTGVFVIIDSEGVLTYKYDTGSLCEAMSIERIPDANGKINVWRFEKTNRNLDKKYYRRVVIKTAAANLHYAEDTEQGSKAILKCAKLIQYDGVKKWALRLCYELNYLVQRKILLLNFLSEVESDKNIIQTVERQVDALCEIRHSMMTDLIIDWGLFARAADLEGRLTNLMLRFSDMEAD